MRHYNGWLWGQLKALGGDSVSSRYSPLISVTVDGSNEKIWFPTPDDYIVTAETVVEVNEVGGTWISYPSAWAGASMEADLKAEDLGMKIMSHKATISIIQRKVGD